MNSKIPYYKGSLGNKLYVFPLSLHWAVICFWMWAVTGRARLIRSHSSARFYFELSGNLNYKIHCNSNYVQNFELEINSI